MVEREFGAGQNAPEGIFDRLASVIAIFRDHRQQFFRFGFGGEAGQRDAVQSTDQFVVADPFADPA
jgi:hypothetical protein